MTDKSNAWGILGSPTKEEIQKWCDMPAGEFAKHVEETKKKLGVGRKTKLYNFNVTVVKTLTTKYHLFIKNAVMAKNEKEATKLFRETFYNDYDNYTFPEKPEFKDSEYISFFVTHAL